MTASAIYFLDIKGKVLISRNYRGDINMSVIEKFMPLLTLAEDEGEKLTPVLQSKDCTFVYITYNNLYIVLTTTKNSNVALLFVLLYKILTVLKEYFKELEKESIKDNFVLIYELLDEIIDFGYPQTTDTKILQEYITQESHKLEIQPRVPMAVTNAVSWRSEGIKYKKNEIFIDILEYVNVLTNAKGNILRNEITGSIQMKIYLTGMPELQLKLNDRFLLRNNSDNVRSRSIDLEDVKFHQCVQISKFVNDRIICFIPPDGQFELMSYRISTTTKPLILVDCIINHYAHSRVDYIIKAKSQYKQRSVANFVELVIPVSPDVDTPKFQNINGKVSYAPERNAIIWRIKSFPGNKEYVMKAHFQLSSIESTQVEAKRPIIVRFEIPYFTCSGIQADHLKVINKTDDYLASVPWVRYLTQNGEYQIRTS